MLLFPRENLFPTRRHTALAALRLTIHFRKLHKYHAPSFVQCVVHWKGRLMVHFTEIQFLCSGLVKVLCVVHWIVHWMVMRWEGTFKYILLYFCTLSHHCIALLVTEGWWGEGGLGHWRLLWLPTQAACLENRWWEDETRNIYFARILTIFVLERKINLSIGDEPFIPTRYGKSVKNSADGL